MQGKPKKYPSFEVHIQDIAGWGEGEGTPKLTLKHIPHAPGHNILDTESHNTHAEQATTTNRRRNPEPLELNPQKPRSLAKLRKSQFSARRPKSGRQLWSLCLHFRPLSLTPKPECRRPKEARTELLGVYHSILLKRNPLE